MRLKGRLCILRRTCGEGPDYGEVVITLMDESSRSRFLEIEIPFREFGMAVVGASEQPCDFEVRMKAPLGKRHEAKWELVPSLPWDSKEDSGSDLAAAAVAPFEVDGWKGVPRDMFNNHNRRTVNGNSFHEIAFHRYVDPPDEAS